MLVQFIDAGIVRLNQEQLHQFVLSIGNSPADVRFKHELIQRAPSKVHLVVLLGNCVVMCRKRWSFLGVIVLGVVVSFVYLCTFLHMD